MHPQEPVRECPEAVGRARLRQERERHQRVGGEQIQGYGSIARVGKNVREGGLACRRERGGHVSATAARRGVVAHPHLKRLRGGRRVPVEPRAHGWGQARRWSSAVEPRR